MSWLVATAVTTIGGSARPGEPPAGPVAATVAQLAGAASLATAVGVDAGAAGAAGPDGVAREDQPRVFRTVRAPTVVYAAPSRRADRRGRLTTRRAFAVHRITPAEDCPGEGWAAVDQGGHACLEHAVASAGPAVIQPELAPGRVLPFIYARPRIVDRKTGTIARVPRYRDHRAFKRDEPPSAYLEADRQYVFVASVRRGRTVVLLDADERVVPARGLKIERESAFAGRTLADDPVPAGLAAAWSVARPAALRARPEPAAPAVATVKYHATMHIDPAPIVVGEASWYAVPDGGGPGVAAYVLHEDMNHWIPGPPLAQVGADEVWIDVDVGQQTLAVMRGPRPTFITLISSGGSGNATPRGLFRISEKLAVWSMRSAPEAEDRYFVEGVPWIQYFHRRFALHAAYWHDDFGKRRSHGCINLSPRDAAYVFSRTGPHVPPGWNALVEHAGDPGTLVRVRRGDEAVPDLRGPLGLRDADADADELAGQDP